MHLFSERYFFHIGQPASSNKPYGLVPIGRTIVHFLFVLLFLTGCGTGGSQTSIEGIISENLPGFLSIVKVCGDGMVPLDSVKADSHGHFHFEVNLEEHTLLSLNSRGWNHPILLLVEPSERISVNIGNGPEAHYNVSGSRASALIRELAVRHYGTIAQVDSLATLFKRHTRSERFDSIQASIRNQYATLIEQHKEFVSRFVKVNCYSLASMAGLFAQYPNGQYVLDPCEDFELFQNTHASLSALYESSSYVIALGHWIERTKRQNELKVLQGNMLSEGKWIDLKGIPFVNELDASKFKSARIILLDFWGSWCASFNHDDESLLNLYDEYHPKGFEVVRFVFDKELEREPADSIPWIKAWDPKLWNSNYVQQLAIETIPSNYLVSSEGIILERNLSSKGLQKTLEKMLGPVQK